MLTGRRPELGGRPDYLDIAGLNYYSDNQWRVKDSTIPLGHHHYRPCTISGRRPRALPAAALPRRDRRRAQRARRLAVLRWRRGPRRHARGRAGRGHLPLPSSTTRAGKTSATANRPVLARRPDGHRSTCHDLAEELARQQALVAELHRPIVPPSGAVALTVVAMRIPGKVLAQGECRAPFPTRGAVHLALYPAPRWLFAGLLLVMVVRPLRRRRPVRHAPAGRRHGVNPADRSAVWCPLVLFIGLIGLESDSGARRLAHLPGVVATGVDIRLDLFEHLSGHRCATSPTIWPAPWAAGSPPPRAASPVC